MFKALVVFGLIACSCFAKADYSIVCDGNSPNTLGAYLSMKLLATHQGFGTYDLFLSRISLDKKVDFTNQVIATNLFCRFGKVPNVVTAECFGGSKTGPEHFSIVHHTTADIYGTRSSYEVVAQSPEIATLKKTKALDVEAVFGNNSLRQAQEVIDLFLDGVYTCRQL